jgi:hypothetical protein
MMTTVVKPFDNVNVLIESWMVEEPGADHPVVGKPCIAALELWVDDVKPTAEVEDSLTEVQSNDLQCFGGAAYEIVGTMRWWRDVPGWFVQSGGLTMAGGDIMLGCDLGHRIRKPVAAAEVPHRALITATVAIAPEGMWAYWPEANATRSWMVNSVSEQTAGWLLNLSPMGPPAEAGASRP